ncbi:MAG TPA: hypothetical protein VMA83_08230 [Solirubrobacteraceae bacterium]|nr:hypothetical protein [Solirubrobacteraceae bacterium]
MLAMAGTLLVALASFAGTSSANAAQRKGGAAHAKEPRALAASKRPQKPKKTARPTITGVLQDGQLLTAEGASWEGAQPITLSYQWKRCGRHGCTPIAGAEAQTYRAQTADTGDRLQVAVTATNSVGHATASSRRSSAIAPGPPVDLAAPNISGTPIVGATLEANAGEWAGTPPITYHYQWLGCNLLDECAEIAGASEATYTVGPLEVGDSFEVRVTASNAAGTSEATSGQTSLVGAVLPKNTELPGVVGSLVDGQLLKAAVGAWSGTEPLRYSYEWLLCNAHGDECASATEAGASTLSLISTDVGKTVRVAVTATNEAGSTTATSPATSVVAALLPSNTELPSIAGSLVDGQLLNAATGAWSGTTPISYSYQWELCNSKGEECAGIPEAVASTLSLISTDVGKTVRVAVTATNEAGSMTATSPATSVVAALLPSDTELPSIAGSLVDGQLLNAATGAWSGTTPISYSYQWELCNSKGEECSDISEATNSALSLVSAFVGKTVRVAVTATNAAGSRTAASEATGIVAALLPSNTELPAISGLLQVGQLLHASEGKWKGTTPIKYTYQWQSCLLGTCQNISKAVESALKLELGDIGLAFRVIVTATNAAGSTSANSAITGLLEGGL